jgi:hypothetical protein
MWCPGTCVGDVMQEGDEEEERDEEVKEIRDERRRWTERSMYRRRES